MFSHFSLPLGMLARTTPCCYITESCMNVPQGITMLVLATDMARHGEVLELFKANSAEGGFDISVKDHFDSV